MDPLCNQHTHCAQHAQCVILPVCYSQYAIHCGQAGWVHWYKSGKSIMEQLTTFWLCLIPTLQEGISLLTQQT